MSFSVKVSAQFEKELKKLAKKYPSLKNEYISLVMQLAENPALGTPIGKDCYKIRVAVTSKGKGKSGGARVITYVQIDKETVLLLSIYSKGQKDSVSDKELRELLEKYGL